MVGNIIGLIVSIVLWIDGIIITGYLLHIGWNLL